MTQYHADCAWCPTNFIDEYWAWDIRFVGYYKSLWYDKFNVLNAQAHRQMESALRAQDEIVRRKLTAILVHLWGANVNATEIVLRKQIQLAIPMGNC